MSIATDLLGITPAERKAWMQGLDDDERAAVFVCLKREFGTPWALWRDDPVGFIQDALGEYVWSKQAEISRSVVENRRTVCSACHAPGKTWLAARLVVWWTVVHEPGTALTVTTATAWKQVQKGLWPHIIRIADKHNLPGTRNQTEWYIEKQPVAYGFAQNKYDEACFDAQTELLTDDGWKFFPDVRGDEQVLTLNGDVAEWGTITQVHRYPFDGYLNLHDGQRLNFCITDNHRLLVRNGSDWRLERYDTLPDDFVIRRTNAWQTTPLLSGELHDSDVGKRDVTKIRYTGTVHCVSTPHETIMVRRKGCPMWSGNSAQGVHADRLLIVVDEAGGIVPLLGENLNSITTGDNTRFLAIGNPPTDEEGAWFQTIFDSPLWHPITISAFSTPNFTGEECPSDIAKNLIDKRWVEEVRSQYGVESAYWTARVLAQFPKTFASKVIPMQWIEDAMENENPVHSDWQRLGVDVAADGGDEMCVALADGNNVSVQEVWANADAANQVANAERVLEWILRAQGVQSQRGYISRKVRVKIDNIGVGAGTADILERMGKDDRHHAEIVRVDVRERATQADRFSTRRAEMWWNLRECIRDGTLKLLISEKEKAQIGGPTYKTDSGGRTMIEAKDVMRRRGLPSPDRADAIAMAVYEPTPPGGAVSYASQLSHSRVAARVARRSY